MRMLTVLIAMEASVVHASLVSLEMDCCVNVRSDHDTQQILSVLIPFVGQCSRMFQLLLSGVNNCQEWSVSDELSHRFLL